MAAGDDAFPIPTFSPGEYDPDEQARLLIGRGYVVLPLLGHDYPSKYPDMLRSIETMLQSMPEFKDGAKEYTIGGFGVLNNPSSFHNPLVRTLRQWAMSYLYPMLTRVNKSETARLEQVLDRFMVREPHKKPTAEMWHRDTSPRGKVGDDIFGGWINLDERNQYYSAVPGSHLPGAPKGAGFDRLSDAAKAHAEANKVRITIPPGHIITFYQNMVHEVLAKSAPHRMFRLFVGFRLTDSPTPLTPNLSEVLTKQGPPEIKSGQQSEMYNANHARFHMERIIVPWANHFHPSCLETITRKSGKNKGASYNIVQRVLRPLTDLGLPTYPPYTDHERKALEPHRSHRLLKPGNPTSFDVFSFGGHP